MKTPKSILKKSASLKIIRHDPGVGKTKLFHIAIADLAKVGRNRRSVEPTPHP